MPNLLREFEARLGSVVEGAFGAMFRSTVQPAELAKAASKEMSRSRKLSIGKMYVSNVYFVFVSQKDADTMGDLIPTIEGELESYLLAFARERDYHCVTRPIVRFSVDPDFKRAGKFDIVGQQMTPDAIYQELGRVAGVTDELEEQDWHGKPPAPGASPQAFNPTPPRPAVADPWAGAPTAPPSSQAVAGAPTAPPPPAVAPTAAPIPPAPPAVPAVPVAPPVPPVPPVPVPMPVPDPHAVGHAPISGSGTPRPTPPVAHPTAVVSESDPETVPVASSFLIASVVLPGKGEIELDPQRRYIAGRQSTCDLPIPDANISRQHAELSWDGSTWSVRDLGSTNGTAVNGSKLVGAASLINGDRITLGTSTLIFHEANRSG